MNKITFAGILVAVAGCAPTSQIEEFNAKIRELESKIARIEGDLYRVEPKTAPEQKTEEPKFIPAKDVAQNVIDTKIDAFIKEYIGVKFGDGIESYPKLVNEYKKDRLRYLPVQKKFKYFDKAIGRFTDGKLYSISFVADIDEKYSIDSTNERIEQALADFAVTVDLASDTFIRRRQLLPLYQRRKWREEAKSSYALTQYDGECSPVGYRRCGFNIENVTLRRTLESAKRARERAKGETLPEAK